MEIKKVANLSQSEFDALINTGKILGELCNALAEGTVDELSDGAKSLITGLANVISDILK